ncbi:hypothetical protein QUF79_14630 [Fictibacillus enclensis]|uniref:tail completion protein gp17 n=1 Tax=Fictibacillus enclensis TaxID=1017270 RepID=UPI0025A2BD1A|nr:hypothetical protein [Fictibacillus enclensis]MDM5199254.1 hypothetical protein [Fictibacillus enclensis]
MIDPLGEVYEELSGNVELLALMGNENVFTIAVPDDYQKFESAPIIRINEINNSRSAWADDAVVSIDVDIQIDIWTRDYETLSQLTFKVDQIMANLEYQQYNGITNKDPDIGLLRKARRYRATKEVEVDINL